MAQEADAKKILVPPAQAAIVGKADELEQNEDGKAKGKGNRKKGRANEIANAKAGNSSSPGKFDERRAADLLLLEIRDCLSLRKTLVVWVVEQSAASAKLAANMAGQIERLATELKNTPAGKLEMAIVGYGEKVSFLTAEPVSDLTQLNSAIAALKETPNDADKQVRLNLAMNQAAEKFFPYRQRGYEVLFIVVGTSPGDDPEAADAPIAALRRAAVSVYGVAPTVPFAPSAPKRNAKAPPQTTGNTRPVESLQPERIQLALSGNQNAADLSDSGYAPFGIERLARQTGGRVFRLRGGVPGGWDVDPAATDIRWDLLAKYAPNYVSPAQYAALLSENKCRQALHDAALLPPTLGLESPRTDFPKEKDEAAMARDISIAQRVAAERDQPLQRLYDTLAAGESSRPALTGARWQAAYDLALGQTMAAKARLDGYNAMLALLKQGKSFTNPDSKRWVLEPADEISAGSAMDKMAKTSRVYLQRVVKEHPGTPWAAIAERELRYPAGWKFAEK